MPGARVRLSAPDVASRPLVGRVEALDTSRLALALDQRDTVVTVDRASIVKLEVSQGRRSFSQRTRPGGMIGGAFGLIGGLVIASSVVEECTGAFCFDDLERFSWGIGGLAVGMVVGAAVSYAATPGERWQPVDLGDLAVQIRAHPDRRGLALTASVAF